MIHTKSHHIQLFYIQTLLYLCLIENWLCYVHSTTALKAFIINAMPCNSLRFNIIAYAITKTTISQHLYKQSYQTIIRGCHDELTFSVIIHEWFYCYLIKCTLRHSAACAVCLLTKLISGHGLIWRLALWS